MLPLHPPPLPGEVLSSYVTRLAGINELPPARLTELLGLKWFWSGDPDVQVTPHDIGVLEQATGHFLRETSVMPLLMRGVGHQVFAEFPFLLHGSGPVCPYCLAENGAVQRHWRLASTVVCERHGDALQEQDEPPILINDADKGHLLHVQRMAHEGTARGEVRWRGVTLSSSDFFALLAALLRRESNPAAGQRWSLAKQPLPERVRLLARVGERLNPGLVECLWSLREAGTREARFWDKALPPSEWLRRVVCLALDEAAVSCTGGVFRFTDRQWQIHAAALPTVLPVGRHEKQTRGVLEGWLTALLQPRGQLNRTARAKARTLQQAVLTIPSETLEALFLGMLWSGEFDPLFTDGEVVRTLLSRVPLAGKQAWMLMMWLEL